MRFGWIEYILLYFNISSLLSLVCKTWSVSLNNTCVSPANSHALWTWFCGDYSQWPCFFPLLNRVDQRNRLYFFHKDFTRYLRETAGPKTSPGRVSVPLGVPAARTSRRIPPHPASFHSLPSRRAEQRDREIKTLSLSTTTWEKGVMRWGWVFPPKQQAIGWATPGEIQLGN